MESITNIHSIFKDAPRRKLKKGEVLYHAQETPNYVFRLTAGRIKLWQYGLDTARNLNYHIYEYADIFGYLEPLTNLNKRRNAAVALDFKTIVQFVSIKQFMQKVATNPALQVNLLNLVLRDLDSITRRWILRQDNSVAEEKILVILKELAEERGRQHPEGIIIPPLSHQELANYIGVARQCVSTAVKALERANYLRYNRNRILVLRQAWKNDLE